MRADSTTAQAQRRFERRVFYFFLPLLLLIGAGEAVLWQMRETWPLTKVIQYQSEHRETLFMRGILDQGFYAYKLRQIQEREPKILALGSSRVMEFRAQMFGERAAEFYNAGGLIQNLPDLEAFSMLPLDHESTLVLLGIDLWWFNEAIQTRTRLEEQAHYDAAKDWQAHVKGLRMLF
jgi:hypothetical protein